MAAPVAGAAVMGRRRFLQLGGAMVGSVAAVAIGGGLATVGLVATADSALGNDGGDLIPAPTSIAAPGDGPRNANGWAWPSHMRGLAQGFHDGYSVDLVSADGGPLYSPYDGIVRVAGGDGGGIPGACMANPGWWRGENSTVVIEHHFEGRVMFSSHNHVQHGSTAAMGIHPGMQVRSGQTVALSGMSGCTSGPHTHFTLASSQRNWMPDINPFSYIGNP